MRKEWIPGKVSVPSSVTLSVFTVSDNLDYSSYKNINYNNTAGIYLNIEYLPKIFWSKIILIKKPFVQNVFNNFFFVRDANKFYVGFIKMYIRLGCGAMDNNNV